jgi:sortase (surface protein transpeptidase)
MSNLIIDSLIKDYIAFSYEELGTKTNRMDAQSSAATALASQFNQQAREEVRSQKAQQEDRMQEYFSGLKGG